MWSYCTPIAPLFSGRGAGEMRLSLSAHWGAPLLKNATMVRLS
jgi:hypothetical protein